jgi:hypothetical protein
MKIFNTLQQLWSYSLFCPICKDICRDILVISGPDTVWSDGHSSKLDNIINISGKLHINKQAYTIKVVIDCVKNSFEFFIFETLKVNDVVKKASSPYLFFHIESNCKKCNGSWTIGSDIELNLLTRKVDNIGVETEEIWIPGYVINYEHIINRMTIHKTHLLQDEDGECIDKEDKGIVLPMCQFDFKNMNKTIQKIKTMITFS